MDAFEELLLKQLPAGLATRRNSAFSNAPIEDPLQQTTKEEIMPELSWQNSQPGAVDFHYNDLISGGAYAHWRDDQSVAAIGRVKNY